MYKRVCSKCGSTDTESNFSNGRYPFTFCNACGFSASGTMGFIEVEESQLEDFQANFKPISIDDSKGDARRKEFRGIELALMALLLLPIVVGSLYFGSMLSTVIFGVFFILCALSAYNHFKKDHTGAN